RSGSIAAGISSSCRSKTMELEWATQPARGPDWRMPAVAWRSSTTVSSHWKSRARQGRACPRLRVSRSEFCLEAWRRKLHVKIRTLIVDDELLARRNLSSLLELEPDFELIGECAEGRSAVAAIAATRPDLVFLDVQMPLVDGFGVLAEVATERMPLVIFVTAYDQFAVKAFEAQALDYLLKPFRRERFRASLDRVRRSIAARNSNPAQTSDSAQSMIVKTRDRLAFIHFDSLEFIRAAANYVQLHLVDATYEVRERIAV